MAAMNSSAEIDGCSANSLEVLSVFAFFHPSLVDEFALKKRVDKAFCRQNVQSIVFGHHLNENVFYPSVSHYRGGK